MGIIVAKIRVKCPIDGKEVLVNEQCVTCPKYKHLGLHGSKAVISCKLAKGSD